MPRQFTEKKPEIASGADSSPRQRRDCWREETAAQPIGHPTGKKGRWCTR